MQYHEIKPAPPLNAFVKCFWFLGKDFTGSLTSTQTILPDGCMDLVLQTDTVLYQVLPSGHLRLPLGFLIGPQTRPLTLTASGPTASFGVRFYAHGVYPVLRLSPKELVDQILDIQTLPHTTSTPLLAIITTPPTATIWYRLEQFLLQQLANQQPDITPVRAALQLLYHHQGQLSTTTLAHATNFTLRSLERKFRDVTGLSPKQLARIFRFNRLTNDLMLHPNTSLLALAFRYGYFDQAHLSKDFKDLTGQAPSAFVQEVKEHRIRFYK